jgi:hypothetical protein
VYCSDRIMMLSMLALQLLAEAQNQHGKDDREI